MTTWPEPFPLREKMSPPIYRRKIIAELRDHLQTAVNRELLLTGDAARARQNVLIRFGDPARLASKLWFDAMWEKIMMQRWMLAALVVVVVVSVGSMGLTCFLVVQAGQMNQALLEQNRAANEVLLARLAAIGNAPGSTGKSMEWNSLKVRLSLEKASGRPAAGFKVELQGRLLDTSVPTSLDRTTGPDGIADFGLVRPGQHLLNVQTPWGETIADSTAMGFLQISGEIVTVVPGEPLMHEIVCPLPPEEAALSFAVAWPEELAGRPLWLVCDFVMSPREGGSHKWAGSNNEPRFLVVNPSGQVTNPDMRGSGDESTRSARSFLGESFVQADEMRYYVRDSKSFADVPGIYRISGISSGSPYTIDPIRPPPYIWIPRSAPASQLKWPAGAYSVQRIAIGCDSDALGKPDSPQDASLPDLLHPEFLGAIELAIDDPARDRLIYPDERQAQASRPMRKGTKTEIPAFEAVPGRLNEWRLSLPKRLVELLTEPTVAADADPPGNENALPRAVR